MDVIHCKFLVTYHPRTGVVKRTRRTMTTKMMNLWRTKMMTPTHWRTLTIIMRRILLRRVVVSKMVVVKVVVVVVRVRLAARVVAAVGLLHHVSQCCECKRKI